MKRKVLSLILAFVICLCSTIVVTPVFAQARMSESVVYSMYNGRNTNNLINLSAVLLWICCGRRQKPLNKHL